MTKVQSGVILKIEVRDYSVYNTKFSDDISSCIGLSYRF